MIETAAAKTRFTSPFDDPAAWGSPAYEPPLPQEEVERVQKEIDSVVGVTRDNRPIAVLAWNGDTKYWKDICLDWDAEGEPVAFIKRPIVLYRTVRNPVGKLLRDEFPPRWLILTRIEPEQYADTWERDSRVFLPDRGTYVRVKPSEPPKEWHVWFMTVAEHTPFCCGKAAEEGRTCYGRYAHPNLAVEELRRVRKGMEQAKLPEHTPFDSPDRVVRKLREAGVNNYVEQSLRAHDERRNKFIDSIPIKPLRDELRGDHREHLARLDKHLTKQTKG
jgi:hypothetical protein